MTWPDSRTGCKSDIKMVGTSAIWAARTPTVSTFVLMCKHIFPSFLGVLQAWFELIPLPYYHAYSFLIENKWRTLCFMKFHLAFNSCGFVDVMRNLWVIWLFQLCLDNCLLYSRGESNHSNAVETRVISTLYIYSVYIISDCGLNVQREKQEQLKFNKREKQPQKEGNCVGVVWLHGKYNHACTRQMI